MKNKKKMKNKAISPIISTVLLILIVIILATIIFLWGRGFIKERLMKFDKPIENVCSEISIKTFINENIDPKTFGFTNTGNVPINSFDLKTSKSGKSTINRIDKKIDVGLSVEVENYDYDDFEEIMIIPVLLGKTKEKGVKEYACPEKAGFVV